MNHLMTHQALFAFCASGIPALKVGIYTLSVLKWSKVQEDQGMATWSPFLARSASEQKESIRVSHDRCCPVDSLTFVTSSPVW
jgi:hypothetical protein